MSILSLGDISGSTNSATTPLAVNKLSDADDTSKSCLKCGKSNPPEYSYCSKCGQALAGSSGSTSQEEPNSAQPLQASAETGSGIARKQPPPTRPFNNQQQPSDSSRMTPQQKLYFQQEYDKQIRNPSTALVLTLLLGGLGAHRFYLRQWGWGVAYVLFCWTFIPVIVAFCECFVIRKRTKEYNERCANEVLEKMNVIFSDAAFAVTVR